MPSSFVAIRPKTFGHVRSARQNLTGRGCTTRVRCILSRPMRASSVVGRKFNREIAAPNTRLFTRYTSAVQSINREESYVRTMRRRRQRHHHRHRIREQERAREKRKDESERDREKGREEKVGRQPKEREANGTSKELGRSPTSERTLEKSSPE